MHSPHSLRDKQIVIIGAGLAGLSTAWHLQKRGVSCQVFEREPEVGGLCRSKRVGGFVFDYCGHLIHSKHQYALHLIRQLLGDNLSSHKRSSWIYSHGRYTHYPFQANLYGLPAAIIKECLVGFIEASKNGPPRNSSNFLEWICATFGKGIARHFMIPYNRKFWTVSPKKITCSWFDGFIPVPSLPQLIEGTIQAANLPFGYNALFWYPKRYGIHQLPLALASGVDTVQTQCEIAGIDIVRKELMLASGQKQQYDVVVSTIPMPDLVRILSHTPRPVVQAAQRLRWNSIFNVNIGINTRDRFGRHWAYFPERGTSFFRVGYFSNFSSFLSPQDSTALYAEVAYSKEKGIDKNAIVARVIKDLEKVGILADRKAIVATDVNDITYGYPIYDHHYHTSRAGIIKFLAAHDIVPAGRYGSWRYLSMEDVILDGKMIADRLADKQ